MYMNIHKYVHTTFSPHLLGGFFIPLKKKDQGTSSDCYIFEAPHGVLSVKHGTTRTTRWSRRGHFRVTMGIRSPRPNATGNPYEIVGLIKGTIIGQ